MIEVSFTAASQTFSWKHRTLLILGEREIIQTAEKRK